MQRLFGKIILFITITLLALISFNLLIGARISSIYIDKPSYVISNNNLQFDYICGGSSRVHNNFNTLLFDSITGLKGFNIGYGGSAIIENYTTLYLFLKSGNRTKNYLLQVEDNSLINQNIGMTYPFHDYFFFRQIGDPVIDEAYKNSLPDIKYYLWKYIPFIKYCEFNNYYSLKKIIKPPLVDGDMLLNKGYNKLDILHKPAFPKNNYEAIISETRVDTININYLKKIQELCKQNHINFIIYSAPVYQPSYESYKPKNLRDSLLNFVKQNNIPYYNFISDSNFKNVSLFYDETHLNAIGTDKFTKQLATNLVTLLKSNIHAGNN